MIDYKAIRLELQQALMKSKQGKKQEKVPVQKTVKRKNTGKTFMQTFYVNPQDIQNAGRSGGYGAIDASPAKRTTLYPGSFADLKEAEAVLGAPGDPKGALEIWHNKLGNDESGAVNAYTGFWFNSINGLLRKTLKHPLDAKTLSQVKRYTHLLEGALDKYVLKKDVVLHRQVGMHMLSEFQQKFVSGEKTYYDPGFFSTTAIQDSFKRPNTIDLVIKVPAGKGRGAWVKYLSRYPKENEFLINNHSEFTIDNIRQVDGRWQVELTWVKRAVNQPQ